MKVLYLGAANGTTVSHVADYVEVVYAVEFAPRPMQDLLEVARRRTNVMPIMADASCPEQYAPLVETVDLLYQDVAQPDQAAIALRNCVFLKAGGSLILMLKTRSVDIRKQPAEVFRDTLDILMSAGLTITESTWLAPYHQDHAAIVVYPDSTQFWEITMPDSVSVFILPGPLTLIALIVVIGLVVIIVPLCSLALPDKAITSLVGLSWLTATALVILILLCSLVDIPIWKVRRETIRVPHRRDGAVP